MATVVSEFNDGEPLSDALTPKLYEDLKKKNKQGYLKC